MYYVKYSYMQVIKDTSLFSLNIFCKPNTYSPTRRISNFIKGMFEPNAVQNLVVESFPFHLTRTFYCTISTTMCQNASMQLVSYVYFGLKKLHRKGHIKKKKNSSCKCDPEHTLIQVTLDRTRQFRNHFGYTTQKN